MDPTKLKLVADWWRVRCVEGCQLDPLDEFIEGWDYFGAGPWFPFVALAALRSSFIMANGHKLNTGDFRQPLIQWPRSPLFVRVVPSCAGRMAPPTSGLTVASTCSAINLSLT